MTTREAITRRLADVQEELDNMPVSKFGSQWHADRCSEVRAMVARLEMMSKGE